MRELLPHFPSKFRLRESGQISLNSRRRENGNVCAVSSVSLINLVLVDDSVTMKSLLYVISCHFRMYIYFTSCYWDHDLPWISFLDYQNLSEILHSSRSVVFQPAAGRTGSRAACSHWSRSIAAGPHCGGLRLNSSHAQTNGSGVAALALHRHAFADNFST